MQRSRRALEGIRGAAAELWLWVCRRLGLRFYYDSPHSEIARSIGLLSCPAVLVVGFAALFFGPWVVLQGVLCIVAACVLWVVERPLFARFALVSSLREAPLRVSFVLFCFALPLFFSWNTLIAGGLLLTVAGVHLFVVYLSPDEDETASLPVVVVRDDAMSTDVDDSSDPNEEVEEQDDDEAALADEARLAGECECESGAKDDAASAGTADPSTDSVPESTCSPPREQASAE
eukprot:m51a1_g5790 hypothetical protein (233) ;mRNA; r:34477-35357